MCVCLFFCHQVGGNTKLRDFFASQSDIRMDMNIRDKYNSRAAALYRDKVRVPL